MPRKSSLPHPNKLPFRGVLTFVDRPSEKSPSGAQGHRIVLERVAAESALGSLIGMGVNVHPDLGHHLASNKCGVITRARMRGDGIVVRGYLYAIDCAEQVRVLREAEQAGGANALGMSYELHNARVTDMRQPVWRVSRLTFTGASVLLATKAAVAGTSFTLEQETLKPESVTA